VSDEADPKAGAARIAELSPEPSTEAFAEPAVQEAPEPAAEAQGFAAEAPGPAAPPEEPGGGPGEAALPASPSLITTRTSSHVLEVRGLRRVYGRKVAVADVGFSMATGEVTGLLGPNGAGKTTVFYMIVGFIRPTAGKVYLDHHEISRLPMFRRARLGIAYLPQEPSVFRKLSVADNVMAILETRADLTRAEKKKRLDQLLEEFGIAGLRKQPAYTLSGGERRRTEIARALATEPKFLLLDEPFAGIDPIAVHEIKGIVRRLSAAGIGVLITDHNVRDTLDITHRAHVINLGRIVVSGDRDEVLAADMARKIYLGEEFRM
jgi:lipopolysaccharide export system ATP-binding protein